MKRILREIRNISNIMHKQYIGAHAASTAFFFFLSIVPMLMVVCAIIPYTNLTEANLVRFVVDFTPEKFHGLLTDLIAQAYASSAGILTVAAVFTVWSAGKGNLALMRGLNAINGVREKRNYVVVRTMACIYTVLFLIGMVVSLSVIVFGEQILDLVTGHFPSVGLMLHRVLQVRFLYIWPLLTLIFALIYTILPDRKLHFTRQLPGAMISALAWSAFSWGFSLYAAWSDPTVFGSLSIILLIMLWLYFCAYIVLIGAFINRYFTVLAMRSGKKKSVPDEGSAE